MSNSSNMPARGVLQMICGALSFSVMAVFVKLTSRTIPSVEIVFFRSLLGTLAIGALIWKEKASWRGKNVKILLLRGMFGFFALSLHFYAISRLQLGTAVI